MTNFGKVQLYFKFNVFCEEIPSVAKKNLLLRTFLSSSSSGVGRRESRRINFALKLELLRYFIIGCRFHHFFSNNSKMWDIFTWWYFGRSFSPPPSPWSWQWQNTFFKPQRIRNSSRRKMTQEMWWCQPGKGCSYLWAPASQASVPAWSTRTPCAQAWRQVGPRPPCCPRPCTGSDRPPRHPPRTRFLHIIDHSRL